MIYKTLSFALLWNKNNIFFKFLFFEKLPGDPMVINSINPIIPINPINFINHINSIDPMPYL